MKITISCPVCGKKHQEVFETSDSQTYNKAYCCGSVGLIDGLENQKQILNASIVFWNHIQQGLGDQIFASPKLININRDSRTTFALSDNKNPTGSMKDRASALCIWDAVANNKHELAVASCGNAAYSLAFLSQVADIKSTIFLPKKGTELISKKILSTGASIVYTDTYQEAVDACKRYINDDNSVYSRLTGLNPLTRLGKSSYFNAEEIKNTLSESTLYVPVGDGNFASSLLYLPHLKEMTICLYYPKNSGNTAFTQDCPLNSAPFNGSKVKPLDVVHPQDKYFIRKLLTFPNIMFKSLPEKAFCHTDNTYLVEELKQACEVFSGGLKAAETNDITQSAVVCHTGNSWK